MNIEQTNAVLLPLLNALLDDAQVEEAAQAVGQLYRTGEADSAQVHAVLSHLPHVRVKILNVLAVKFWELELFDEVIPLLQAALELEPANDDTLYNLGYILYALGEYEMAYTYLNQIRRRDEGVLDLMRAVRRGYEAAESDRVWASRDIRRENSNLSVSVINLIQELSKVFRPGRTLQAGCGAGEVVHALVQRGWDAFGMDPSAFIIERNNQDYPSERYFQGDLLGIPCEDEAFDNFFCFEGLDRLDAADVPVAIGEISRVAKHAVFCQVSATPERPLRWWQELFFQAGFRKHPLYQWVVHYEALENEAGPVLLILEKIPEQALAAYPLQSLARMRDLHMDMLREYGRRSDAHVARYMLASSFVKPNDRILDVACGLGYGSALLWDRTEASSVLGVDVLQEAADYAACNYQPGRPGVSYRSGDAMDLHFVADHSIDLVVSMETVEHLTEPEKFFRELQRVLAPGGRVILSVPNLWLDETGKDPNPYHFHEFDREKIMGLVADHLLLEKTYSQIAGGGMKHTHGQRALFEVPLDVAVEPDAEWWIVVGMNDPVSDAPYQENAYALYRDIEQNIVAFERQYVRPWIQHSLVWVGHRVRDKALLKETAMRFAAASPDGSPDLGAALCILGYLALEAEHGVDEFYLAQMRKLEDYLAHAPQKPLEIRWAVSNSYLLAQMHLNIGDRERAGEWFRRCCEYDFASFSLLLGTKTVSAYYMMGLLRFADGQVEEARHWWKRAVERVKEAFTGDWANILGADEFPLKFGADETGEVFDLLSRCVESLHQTATGAYRPHHVMRLFTETKVFRLKQQSMQIEALIRENHALRAGSVRPEVSRSADVQPLLQQIEELTQLNEQLAKQNQNLRKWR